MFPSSKPTEVPAATRAVGKFKARQGAKFATGRTVRFVLLVKIRHRRLRSSDSALQATGIRGEPWCNVSWDEIWLTVQNLKVSQRRIMTILSIAYHVLKSAAKRCAAGLQNLAGRLPRVEGHDQAAPTRQTKKPPLPAPYAASAANPGKAQPAQPIHPATHRPRSVPDPSR
jgi:hypothetical protein